ncbi:hypothetical protein [Alterisphingorhabdus coralli]|uniref:DUF4136 domain-containing protein n=1 Tax=Alterisphingorhabdus coralli TaxID=3071408 RepID=A0AA97F9K5_9SPHN|nr:hypothetical protein [Parasphingorhabdus sp. SCSIO 66989]WOE75773.1 hypothetical protein RB602_03400 [Parasphingorhabdus sp. SCSIO 66989]
MRFSCLILLASAALVTACTTPIAPGEITRFHLPERAAELGRGSIAIVPLDETQLSTSGYAAFEQRLARILIGQGYDVVNSAQNSDQIATIDYRLLDTRNADDRAILTGGGPAAIGTGGSVGGTLTIPFGGSPQRVYCRLRVSINDRQQGDALWEARGQSEAKPGTPEATPAACADKMLSAVFSDFPGRSGETISVP